MREFVIQIKIFLLQCFLDPYGEQYFKWYKRIVERSWFNRDAFRELDSINIRESLSSFLCKSSKFLKSSPTYDTNIKIRFSAFPFGTSLNAFKKAADKPNYVAFERFENAIFVVYTYKDNLLGRKTSRSFYFCNDELFFGAFTVKYDWVPAQSNNQFSFSPEKLKHSLIEDLFDFYGIHEPINLSEDFFIKDQEESVLLLHDNGFSLQIRYFSRKNLKIFSTLLRLFESDFSSNLVGNSTIKSFLNEERPLEMEDEKMLQN